MKKVYFTVGPSEILPSIPTFTKQAINDQIFSLSHRGKVFEQIFEDAVSQLRKLLLIPTSYQVFFISSGTEAMERVIQNCVGEKCLHVINGNFAERFYKTALELGKNAQRYNAADSFSAKDLQVIKDIELIAFTQNDTSTGMAIPLQEIYKTARKYPQALIALDTVSSMPYVDINYKKVDAVFFSVQKGFGMPSGLGILILSPRAINKAKDLKEKGVSIGSYHSFLSLLQFADKKQTPDTPNVFAIYLFEKVVKEFLKKGIKNIRKETESKASMLYEFFERSQMYSPLIVNNNFRSKTTLTVTVRGGSSGIVKYLLEREIVVGKGYGERKDQDIRIANFPAHTKKDIKLLINLLKNYAGTS